MKHEFSNNCVFIKYFRFQILLKTEYLFGDYTCQVFQDLSLEPSEVSRQVIEVIRGKKAPTVKLTPEWVGMTSVKFTTGISEIQKEEFGVDLPLVGYVIQYKLVCHIGGEWTSANFTIHDEGKQIR